MVVESRGQGLALRDPVLTLSVLAQTAVATADSRSFGSAGTSPDSGMTGFDWLRCFMKKRVWDGGTPFKSHQPTTANAKQSDLRFVA